MMMNPGPSSDETEGEALAHDVACVLLDYTRDRPDGGVIGRRLTEAQARVLAGDLARELALRIGGRYVPRMVRVDEARRRKRDAAVVAAFSGRNHAEVITQFKISRRLLYAILARARSRK